MKKLCCLYIIIILSGCGLTPVYHQGKGVAEELAAIDVVVNKTREGQIFRVAMEDRLAPQGMLEPEYILEPNLAIRLEPISIEADGTTRRYRLIGQSFFQLKDRDNGEVLLSEKIERFTSYNIADTDFSTYVSSKDAMRQLIESLANDIRFRLMRYFMREKG